MNDDGNTDGIWAISMCSFTAIVFAYHAVLALYTKY